MNKRLIRGYAAALSLLGFSAAWAATSNAPWPGASSGTSASVSANDPRVAALNAREARLRQRAVQVRRIVAARTTAASRPAVQIVTLPPMTRTRTS